MRKTNKVVALLLTLVFLLSAIIPVGAAVLPADVTKATLGLVAYGIVDTPSTIADNLTRGQFAKLAAMSGGKTLADYAVAQAKASIYKDINKVDWYNGWSQLAPFIGVDTAPNFAPKAAVKRIEVLRIMVRLMNIVDVTDNAAFMAQARALKLTDATDAEANLAITRGETFLIIAKALDMNLGARFFLGKTPAPIFAPELLQVTSVTAMNAKQVQIMFNKAVDKTAAETLANYDVFLAGALTADVAGSATLQADGKTVIIELATGAQFVNFTTTNKVVVKAAVGLAADFTNAAVTFSDTNVPSLVSAMATGSNEITLTFTEPVTSAGLPTGIVVNDGAVGVFLNSTYNVSARTLAITTYANMIVGTTYTVKIGSTTNITDYAGYKVQPASASFVYAPVTVAPTYVVKSSTEKTATIQFASAIVANTLAGNANVAFSHTYASANTVTGAMVTNPSGDNKTFVITFANAFPPGTSTMFAAYATGTTDANKIKDAFGNIVTLVNSPITTVADVTAPTATVAMVAGSNTQIEVTYSEAVTGGSTAGNYVLKQGTTVIPFTGPVNTPLTNKYVLTATAQLNGAYTLAISNIKDTSAATNAMATTTYNLPVADSIKPTAVLVGSTAGNAYYITTGTAVRIYFSEAMDMASIATLTNYQTSGGFIATSATPAVDGKSVLVAFAAPPSPASITLGTVKDLAGNLALYQVLSPVAMPNVGLLTTTPAIPNNVVADTTTSVKVYLNDIVTGLTVNDFEITTGGAGSTTYFKPASALPDNSSGKTVVTLTFATAFGANASGVAIRTSTGALAANADGATVSVAAIAAVDKIAPTVSTVTVYGTTQIAITFTELLESSSLTTNLTGVNGFSVVGGTITNARLHTSITDSAVVVIEGTGFTTSTNIVYNGTSITDVNVIGNKLAPFTWSTALTTTTTALSVS